jgi:hypothetical protein
MTRKRKKDYGGYEPLFATSEAVAQRDGTLTDRMVLALGPNQLLAKAFSDGNPHTGNPTGEDYHKADEHGMPHVSFGVSRAYLRWAAENGKLPPEDKARMAAYAPQVERAKAAQREDDSPLPPEPPPFPHYNREHGDEIDD